MTTIHRQAQVTPVVQAAAYAIGTSIGGLLAFPNVCPASGASAIVQGATVTFASGVVPPMDLVLFSATPTGGGLTDRTAVVIANVDLPKVVGVLHLTDATLLGATSPSIVQTTAAVMPFRLSSGSSLYGVLIARGGVTLGTVTDALVSLNVLME